MTAPPQLVRPVILCLALGLGFGWGAASGSAQRRVPSGSFGPVIAQALAFEPTGLCVIPARRRGDAPEIAVLARREPAIHIYTLVRSGLFQETATIGLPGLHRRIACGDIDGDRNLELVALSSDYRSVTVLRRSKTGIGQTRIAQDAPRHRLLIADLTNDGKAEVLLFGKGATGIATVISPRKSVFRPGPVFAPDISIADARVADVNGDGVADLAMLDWVSSRIELLFGITDTVFSEPVSLPVEGEPSAFDLSRRLSGRHATIAIAVPERRTVLTMGIDPTGALVPHEALTLRGPMRQVALREVTGDGQEDLVVAGEEGVIVFSGLSRTRFSAPAEFSVTAEDGLWEIADLDRDGAKDLVVADRHARRLLVLGNARRRRGAYWPDAYAVGRQPREIAAVDCNGDGWQDIVVSNVGSRTISVLLNEGEGRFSGQQSYELPDSPSQLTTLIAPGRKTSFLLTSHAESDQISALIIADGDVTKPELLVMRTGPQPQIQYTAVEGVPPLLRLLVRSKVEGVPGSVALSMFEQLRDDQFLERQFLARFPRRLTALAVGEFQGSGTPDLVLATYDRAHQRTVLSIAPSRGAFEFSTVEPLLVVGDSLRGIRDLICADVDDDGVTDLLLIPEAPRTRIGFVKGEPKQGGLSRELEWIRDVYPSRDILPAVDDVSGDGNSDIVMLDELRGAVVVLYGTGSGRFRPPAVIAPGSGINGLAVGRFRERRKADIAFTFGDQGIVTLLFDPFIP